MAAYAKINAMKRRTRTHHWPLDMLLVAIIVLVDQLSKWWVTEEILMAGNGYSFFEWITRIPETTGYMSKEMLPFINFVMVWNNGISFGLFQSNDSFVPLLITALTALVIVGFIIWMIRTDNRAVAGGLSLVIGGAIGNLIDRLRFEAVIDFLDLHILGWHWPAFNFADTCIVLGIAFVVFDSLFLEPQRRSRKPHDVPRKH